MNCEDTFCNIIGSIAFRTYAEFEEAFQTFQRLSKSNFKIISSTYFPAETVERNILVYKYMSFVCRMHKSPSFKNGTNIMGSGCTAHFSVGSRDDRLKVVKFDMLHNHDLVEPDVILDNSLELIEYESDPAVDLTPTFLRIFTSMFFSSFEDLQSKLELFQQETGSLYTKRHAKKFPIDSPQAANLVYKSFAYDCYHYGTHLTDSKKRNRRSAKIGCRSKIYVSCARNMLNIVRFDVRHNHDVTPERAQCYSRNRRLTASQLLVVENMLHTTQENHTLKEFIETTFNTPVTLSDVRNIKSKLKNTAPRPPSPLSEDAILSQLSPFLEQLQCLVSSSTDRTRFYNRLECLGSLIDLWREDKEAVIVPHDSLDSDVLGFSEITNSQHSEDEQIDPHLHRDLFNPRLPSSSKSRRNNLSLPTHEQCVVVTEHPTSHQIKREEYFADSW